MELCKKLTATHLLHTTAALVGVVSVFLVIGQAWSSWKKRECSAPSPSVTREIGIRKASRFQHNDLLLHSCRIYGYGCRGRPLLASVWGGGGLRIARPCQRGTKNCPSLPVSLSCCLLLAEVNSAAVGVFFFSVYPARRAASLNPSNPFARRRSESHAYSRAHEHGENAPIGALRLC